MLKMVPSNHVYDTSYVNLPSQVHFLDLNFICKIIFRHDFLNFCSTVVRETYLKLKSPLNRKTLQ
jgi:hypothetical protein